MKTKWIVGAALISAGLIGGAGLAVEGGASAGTSLPAVASDNEGIDEVITRLYASISGPAGEDRDWDVFRSCFADGARMGAFFKRPNGEFGSFEITTEEYIERVGPQLVQGGFVEQETHRVLEAFGTVAHAFSTYRGDYTTPEGEQSVSGINSIQLVETTDGWKVYSLVWQQAGDALPIPARYAPPADDTAE